MHGGRLFALREAKTMSGSLDICVSSFQRDDLVEAHSFFLAFIIRPTFARRRVMATQSIRNKF